MILRSVTTRPWLCATIPWIVGFAGLLTTAWLIQDAASKDAERLQLRFQSQVNERIEAITRRFEEQQATLKVLQGVFRALPVINETSFTDILEPLSHKSGLQSFSWAPLVITSESKAVEPGRRAGAANGAAKTGGDGRIATKSKGLRRFPIDLIVANDAAYLRGLDLYSLPGLKLLVDQAIAAGAPVSNGLATPLGRHFGGENLVLMAAPVFRGDRGPQAVAANERSVRGILCVLLDLKSLFAGALPAGSPELRVNLLELGASGQVTARWPPPAGIPPVMKRREVRSFDFAGRTWAIEVAALPAWVETNRTGQEPYVLLAGVLASILLALSLHRLLERSALVDKLEVSREADAQRRQEAEDRADNLSKVVEQNPAAIVITDLRGHIEYVNDTLVETTGYVREEIIGHHIMELGDASDAAYGGMHRAIESGGGWHGELPCCRRDGKHFWERVRVAPIKDRRGRIIGHMVIKEDITELRQLMARLQESENRFRAAMAAMAEGLAVLSSNGVCQFANRAAEKIMGVPENGLLYRNIRQAEVQFLGMNDTQAAHPLAKERILHVLNRDSGLREHVVGMRFPDGRIRWLEVNISPLHTGDTQDRRIVVTFSDITERRQAGEMSRLALEAIRHSGEGILVTDAEHRIISANPAFERVSGFAAAEVLGTSPGVLSSGHQDGYLLDNVRSTLDGAGHWQGEVWNRRKNGEVYPEWLGISTVRGADGSPQYYVYIFSDMSERKAAQERIEFLAHHDPLTGLPNRLMLRDRMQQAMMRAKRAQMRVALMFLDLDRFKKINDSLGHPVGDALLQAVVERLKRCVRASDTISRQGGDEFIILLNDIHDTEAVARVADKIHQRMGQPFDIEEHALMTTFSIGVAIYPDDGEDFDVLLQKADTAMYHAKEAGRNSHRFFTEQMNQQVSEHLALETQLQRALENEEFVLHYQPQLDLQERTIVGIEALLRWNSPEHGLVQPGKFIPVAEESGLIVRIGAWVLREACRQAKAWQDAGLPPVSVAVNLSAIQFRRLDLVNTVINALVLADLDSHLLELELTESILLQDTELTLDTVRRLKSLGVKLSVDDFGTGYSSLSYLKRFAVDKLKIDQSFVRDLLTDPDDAAIVRAIIQMAHSLKLRTIAEGVESEELSKRLDLFRCDEIQGYWLAKPMPADELADFLRNYPTGTGAGRPR